MMLHKISELTHVESYLQSLNVNFDLFFPDLETGESFECGKKVNYPFASCFKLAVLGAVLEKYSSTQLQENIVINQSDVPKLAMGVINYLEAPVELSLSNLLRLMMAFSDGTSTDILIREVGMKSISRFLELHTESSMISHNINDLLSVLLHESNHVSVDSKSVTRHEYRLALQNKTMLQDYSNSKDLTSLLKALLKMGPRAEEYLFRDQGVQRLGMYCLDNVRLYGKTGTLGYWVSANDAVVVVVDGVPRAVVGLMTLGWNQPRYVIEHAFGEVGLMVSNLYRAQPVYSAAYGSVR